MNLNISDSRITNSQIGNVDSSMSIVNSSDVEWEKLEKIWAGALASLDVNTKSYELVRSAQELSQKRDKAQLRSFINQFWREFTVNILSGSAVEIIKKFVL